MKSMSKVSREDIVEAIARAVEPLEYVYALWQGGAISFDRLDQWSDIDLYVDAEDQLIEQVLLVVESALEALSHIELVYEPPVPPPGNYAHRFYRLEGTSEFMLVDLAVIKHTSPDKFLEPEIHDKAVFHFNKHNVVKVPALNRDNFIRGMKTRLERLQTRFEMFRCFIPKEIMRGNSIEAVDLYYRLMLDMLAEVLRMKYKPVHYEFKTRYIHYELPPEIVGRLRGLYFVKDEQDLRMKQQSAEEWFCDTVKQIDFQEIEARWKP